MSGNACPQCGREHPWCDAEWSASELHDVEWSAFAHNDPDPPHPPDPVGEDTEGPPYRVGELLPDILDFLASGSRGPDRAGARESPGRSLRGLIPGPRRRF
ncbi:MULTISPECIES: hypothetical protein [unclassified Embleya]|uniref:hypothetical protein n=1 Tax=unclassified Embleya TaxID=2699296 RepID=UPI0033F3F8D4